MREAVDSLPNAFTLSTAGGIERVQQSGESPSQVGKVIDGQRLDRRRLSLQFGHKWFAELRSLTGARNTYTSAEGATGIPLPMFKVSRHTIVCQTMRSHWHVALDASSIPFVSFKGFADRNRLPARSALHVAVGHLR
ncbi:MAG: hypothetical protein DMF95_07770 [Acidobacteria bacterium]|nr:MAG: hypothetical protein DMF96_07075 [Acidobacteriota bacterium]PYR23497.1 MAG: hypothetical protein DMF94_01105 [Acidobacteriota bacterium]PYR51821.1 MAG: hypothetical protein DMF95_07770 [Acidobacteriota bacterium]